MEVTTIINSLRTLHDLSKAINSSLEIDEVVEMILERTSKLMKTDRVLILLLDKDKMELTINSSLGFEPGEIRTDRFSNIKSFDHCLVHKGTVITLQEVLREDDYRRFRNTMPALFAMFFAPLEIKGRAYGLLGVSGGKKDFTEVELEIFCSLGSQAAVAMENASLYRKLRNTFLHTAEALAEAIDSRDPYTGGHTRRVQEYSMRLAEFLAVPEEQTEALRLAAILHDIGKIGIDDAILRKGGTLSAEERHIMQQHPDIGAKILNHVVEMQDVIPGVRHHHEWFDGSGYPDGLKGEQIPLQARIIAIVDAFDALTTDRPYRKASSPADALAILGKDAGIHFDPVLVQVLARIEVGKS